MKFEDATFKKAKLPKAFIYRGNKIKIFIVPQAKADLEKFIDHIKGHRITDKTALLFSSDNQFTVKGISIGNNYITILDYQELVDKTL